MVSEENRVVNALWIGPELSSLELLTLGSFVANGHTFHLWVYDELKTSIPKGVLLRDANTILPADRIFRYRFKNQFGHGKGSLAGFSDLFRYKLLHDVGGWWVDMDVTCLKPLDFVEPYYLRAHHELSMVGNVMKCPPKSELMLKCFEDAERLLGPENRDWHLPITILNSHVASLDLTQYVRNEHSPPDDWRVVFPYLYSSLQIPTNYYFVHWLNEVWRSKGLDKQLAVEGSTYSFLLNKHHIKYDQAGFGHQLKYRLDRLKEWVWRLNLHSS